MIFHDTTQVRELARDCGNHFFDADSMKHFGSRIHDRVYGGRYFVTSEQDNTGHAWDGQRRYTVRSFDYEDGRFTIDTVGEFGEYATATKAHAVAAKLAGLFMAAEDSALREAASDG